ncbi:N-6 DNA methylase, partial [Streptococcus thermophilus]|nr:N-6 DNA methylase [Streptococcus thermophilus]
KALIDKHQIESVIGFPDKLFLNTGIPVCVLILKKNRANSDILFVDASQGFEKMKNQKQLRPEDIYKITETVIHRKAVDKYSHLAMLEEVIENDYNLNIPRY